MEIILNGKKVSLQKKDRKLKSEAPAIKLSMDSGESKVIGMMAEKVQVFITIPYSDGLSDSMTNILNKHKLKSNIYIVSSCSLDNKIKDIGFSTDFKNFSLKLGVNIDDTLCAKSIFIINKDGEFIYKEILETLEGEFDIEKFDIALDEAIKFKKKGHTHENWMGV